MISTTCARQFVINYLVVLSIMCAAFQLIGLLQSLFAQPYFCRKQNILPVPVSPFAFQTIFLGHYRCIQWQLRKQAKRSVQNKT